MFIDLAVYCLPDVIFYWDFYRFSCFFSFDLILYDLLFWGIFHHIFQCIIKHVTMQVSGNAPSYDFRKGCGKWEGKDHNYSKMRQTGQSAQ